jgi:hypothetical protein
MTPFFGCQAFELFLELARLGRSGQQRADHAEAKAGPLLVKTNRFGWFRHRIFHVFLVAVLAMSEFYQPAESTPTGILCGTQLTLT